jgi:hypothetical protein
MAMSRTNREMGWRHGWCSRTRKVGVMFSTFETEHLVALEKWQESEIVDEYTTMGGRGTRWALNFGESTARVRIFRHVRREGEGNCWDFDEPGASPLFRWKLLDGLDPGFRRWHCQIEGADGELATQEAEGQAWSDFVGRPDVVIHYERADVFNALPPPRTVETDRPVCVVPPRRVSTWGWNGR